MDTSDVSARQGDNDEDVRQFMQTANDVPEPSTPRGKRSRATLVAAARVVFERDGFSDSRLTDITAEAKCSIGSFYTYFDNKEAILIAVFAAAEEDMMYPGTNSGGLDQDDPIAVIEAANRAYFEAYRRNAKLMLLLDQVAGINSTFRDIRRKRGWAFAKRNAKPIARLQERGLADPELDPLLAARALSAMVSRLAYFTFALEDFDDIDALVKTTTRLWANGLGIGRSFV